jgi:hypothetical protein
MVVGFAKRSKSSALIYPESSADSRRVRPVRSASCAIAEALSYPITGDSAVTNISDWLTYWLI